MKPEEIKVGDKVLVEAKVLKLHSDGDVSCYTQRLSSTGEIVRDYILALSSVVRPFCPAPKYDPCRLLKKGDKVQVIARNGRCWGKTGEYLRGAYCFVLEDEERNAMVKVRHNSSEYTIDPAYLELVTPVEEQERYFVEQDSMGYAVIDWEALGYVAHFKAVQHPHAKAAAEAERDRLNAEHRKEQDNG